MKKEKILITGGAGFIGSHTADALAKKGYKIRILDNLEPVVHDGKWPAYLKNRGYELMRGDVRNKRDWQRALRGVSYVYHIAAYQDQRPDFSKFFHTNTAGASLLYEVIAEKKLPVKKVIIASTQFVYGDGQYVCSHNKQSFYADLRTREDFKKKRFNILCPHGSPRQILHGKNWRGKPAKFLPFKESQEPQPTNAYGLSKLASEKLALRFGKTHGVPTTIFRYSIVQGSRQSPRNPYSGAIRIFIGQALKGKPITVFEDGMQTRDFVNVKDVVAANVLALKNKKTDFQTYNVGGGKAHKVLDFANMVKRVLGSGSRIKIGGFRSTDTRHAVSDISKLKKLGWKPKFNPEQSVKEYILWLTGSN